MKSLILSVLFSLLTFSAQAKDVSGMFMSVGNHEVKGEVLIQEREGMHYLNLNEDFQTTMGPDLRIVLRDSSGEHQMKIVSPLRAFEGAQEYKLDLDAYTLDHFDEISIYCAKFHVDFGVAKLK